MRGGIPDNRDVSLSPTGAFGIVVSAGVGIVVVVAEGFDAEPELAVGADAAVGLAQGDAVGSARYVVHIVNVFRRKGDDVVGNLRVILDQKNQKLVFVVLLSCKNAKYSVIYLEHVTQDYMRKLLYQRNHQRPIILHAL